jgi:hypothetical protein
MQQLSQEKIKQIIETYNKCKSLRKVCKQLKISIGSAHKYTTKHNIIHKNNIITKLHSSNKRLIGLYIGLWMGDGTQYYDHGYTIKICSNKKNVLLNKFIQDIIFRLFNKHTRLVNETKSNRANVIYESKFIFSFVYSYATIDEGKKTYTVRLKEDVKSYSTDFLEGCLLGLILTDGYLKRILSFSSASYNLAKNFEEILEKFGFHPYTYVDKRENYKLGCVHVVKLSPKESKNIILLLDTILQKIGCADTFQELKYEK